MTDRRDEEQAASSMLLATADSDDRASNPSPMAMESLSSAMHTGNRERSGAGENSPPANLARNHLAPPHFPFKRHYLAAFLTLPRTCAVMLRALARAYAMRMFRSCIRADVNRYIT